MDEHCNEFLDIEQGHEDLLHENLADVDFCDFEIKEEPLFGDENSDDQVDDPKPTPKVFTR